MDKKSTKNKFLDLLNSEEIIDNKGKRILICDALNLFFRNFSMINMINPDGAHIGGLGGFFRSLGAMIKKTEAEEVYVIFDGEGGSTNRKNLLPEYKSDRNLQKITKSGLFDTKEEEDDSKFDQLIRIIQYLKTLPVKTLTIDGAEADDVIAYLAKHLAKNKDNKIFILSSDQDYIQLVSNNIYVYRPIEKKFYGQKEVKEKFNLPAFNFLIYKTLMGDSSDKIKGIKGLGFKKLIKLFPELEEHNLDLQDIVEICESKLGEHIIYARILDGIRDLEINYKVMDLSNPMLKESDKEYLNKFVLHDNLNYFPDKFISLYNEDQLGRMIKNLEYWLNEHFSKLIK